ncbi:MAG: sugar-binding domain-containing protein [Pseudomonadota bacterium]
MDKTPRNTTGDKEALLSNVALLYYGEGLTQGEIAKRLKVSRATVVNMLRESRDLGIVEIRVDGRHLSGSTLSRDLREAFGLEDVYVADLGEGTEIDRAQTLKQVGRVAATALLDTAEPGNRIGIAWGETILAVAEATPQNPVQGVEVCQLIGSMISERVPASEDCTIQIAAKLGAQCFTLHAPGLISDASLAAKIRLEPTINAQLQRLKSLDLCVYSIGNVAPETHLAAAGMATEDELTAARAQGAVGIVCCRYIDAQGHDIDLPPTNRVIAAQTQDLRAAKKKLLVVCGVDRRDAALAALRGDLVTHLCVDSALAKAMLQV